MGDDAQDWERELELEKSLRRTLLDIGEDGPKPERTKAARAWFAQVSKILKVCAQESLNGQFNIIPPHEVFIVMQGFADYLSGGIIPQSISDVAAKGPLERRHIGYATAYYKAVMDGKISDQSPTETIMEAYGVKRQT